MTEQEPSLPDPCASPSSAALRVEAMARRIGERGWDVCDDFLDTGQIARLAAEARIAWHAGGFRPARVGQGRGLLLSPELRGDHILWLDRAQAPLEDFYAALERLRQAVNRDCFLGLFEFEGHFAIYPPGTFYRRHLDQFEGDRNRKLSCVLYLNLDWKPEHGGALRLYVGGDDYIDVPPRGGTLVSFLSEQFYHEVLPNTVERLSLTGWFRTR